MTYNRVVTPHDQPLAGDDREREAWRERVAAWRRYRDRQPAIRPWRPPADAIAAATWLYDLLPASSRARPVDPSGIVRLRACLSVFGHSR